MEFWGEEVEGADGELIGGRLVGGWVCGSEGGRYHEDASDDRYQQRRDKDGSLRSFGFEQERSTERRERRWVRARDKRTGRVERDRWVGN